jgi:hypothetical protein
MKTTRGKDKGKPEAPAITGVQRAVLDAATPEQLRAMRASINNRLRKTKGGGRPRKND